MAMKETSSSRRDFLRKSLLAAAAATAAPLAAGTAPKGETVKMLTPDGNLVEVSKAALANAPKKKAKSKDILEWRTLKG